MIDQDIYILILEMFDEIKKEEDVIKYLDYKHKCLNNKELLYLIRKHRENKELLENIQDLKYQASIINEINNLNDKINSNLDYIEYLKYSDMYEKRIKDLSKIIFDGIVNVVEGGCNACN